MKLFNYNIYLIAKFIQKFFEVVYGNKVGFYSNYLRNSSQYWL